MEFLPQDDIQGVKSVLKLLFNAIKVEPIPRFPLFCSHIFTDSMAVYIPTKEGPKLLDLNHQENFELWREFIFEKIDKITTPFSIISMINKPYLLAYLKYSRDYLSKKTFSELLAYCWTTSENPNGDVNCSVAEVNSWFRHADKQEMMDEEDYQTFLNFPKEMTIYRGVAIGREPYGLSWTDDIKIAEWFAHRFDTEDKIGYIQEALVKKEWIHAYFSDRAESEIVVDISKVKKYIKIV